MGNDRVLIDSGAKFLNGFSTLFELLWPNAGPTNDGSTHGDSTLGGGGG
jgi:hypothetical protein